MYILISHKSILYILLFLITLKLYLAFYNIQVDFDYISFMLDFEKSSKKALLDVFPKSRLLGCYFHYIKALWNKARLLVLTKKIIKRYYRFNFFF